MSISKTRKTGKTRKSKKAAQGTRKIRSKRSNKKLELKNNKMQLYVGNQLQTSKFAWVSVSDGYIYISRDNNRIYWVLNKIKPEDRPKMSFNDKKQTFKIGNNKIVIKGETDYNTIKSLLIPYKK